MQIWIKNQTYLSDCPESLRIVFSTRLTLPYLTWIENEHMGRWNGKMPQFLCCFETDPAGSLIIPRGHTPYLFEYSGGSGRYHRQWQAGYRRENHRGARAKLIRLCKVYTLVQSLYTCAKFIHLCKAYTAID